MRVIQTFWSGRKNPLVYGYGWINPELNIMSWILSCMCLKKYYDEVILYTDSDGYALFHDLLKLPYTRFEVLYDHINCKEDHWAYFKLISYSLQKKPFIHVDGDVFLCDRLKSKVESGELIAQNLEIGTSYYKGMMDTIMSAPIIIPDILLKELAKDSIPSYNAGIIGGNDIDFISEYCRIAFGFIKNNRLNDPENSYGNINLNILYEQILFYALASQNNKKVVTIIDHPIIDNGYTYNEFCDFRSFGQGPLMHIIGGHKKNTEICRLLRIFLQERYPEFYIKVQRLFPINSINQQK